jgi:hypothetical protein
MMARNYRRNALDGGIQFNMPGTRSSITGHWSYNTKRKPRRTRAEMVNAGELGVAPVFYYSSGERNPAMDYSETVRNREIGKTYRPTGITGSIDESTGPVIRSYRKRTKNNNKYIPEELGEIFKRSKESST